MNRLRFRDYLGMTVASASASVLEALASVIDFSTASKLREILLVLLFVVSAILELHHTRYEAMALGLVQARMHTSSPAVKNDPDTITDTDK